MNWLPEAASSIAGRVDNVIWFVTIISLVFFVFITALLVVFAIKYRRRSEDDETPYQVSHHTLEVVWTIIPSILVMVIFVYGFVVFEDLRTPPKDAMEINVTGKQWLWQFHYDNGKSTINELFVPEGRPVKLVMTSDDVLHSFFVPEFRVKQDLVPGMYTYLWFKAIKKGEFNIFCAEYCGTNHSGMLGKVKVLSPADFEKWKTSKEELIAGANLVEAGAELYTKRACIGCHSIDGSPMVGPTFKGIFGRQETLADGQEITVDENYLRKSIYEPQAQVVKGYQPIMPSFKGIISDNEVSALIAYMKSLK
ncbi:MAG: cytochrome c oxidase subunit II [Candidatus Dadabacteria bacterium]|nr:cytochrome c oxidase subunit II [Candidatus Dadabacteria bacterium]